VVPVSGDRLTLVVAGILLGLCSAGLIRYATGRSRGRRAVRVTGRVVSLEPPAPHADARHGLPVTVAFREPGTGRELAVPATGGRNGRLAAAWPGREVAVRFPPGKPFRFRFTTGRRHALRDLALPLAAGVLCAAVLLVRHAVRDHSPGSVMLGFGLAWSVGWVVVCTHGVRVHLARKALLRDAPAVDAVVVSVVDIRHEDDDHPRYTYSPVVTFTTLDGRAVTGIGPGAGRHAVHDIGSTVTVRYAPADPAVFLIEPSPERAELGCGLVLAAVFVAVGLALAVQSAALLGR
jgi:hypothetical protein